MIDFEKILQDTVDQNQNATWGGCIYALKDLLMFVNNNKDLDTKSKVIIKRQIEDEISFYALNCPKFKLFKLYDEFKRIKKDNTE